MRRTFRTLNDCEMQHNAEVGLYTRPSVLTVIIRIYYYVNESITVHPIMNFFILQVFLTVRRFFFIGVSYGDNRLYTQIFRNI